MSSRRSVGLLQGVELLMMRPCPEGMQRFLVELKTLPGSLDGKSAKGLRKTAGCRDRCAADAAKPVMFDRSTSPGEERVFLPSEECASGHTKAWGA